MENMGIFKLVQELRKLNPSVNINFVEDWIHGSGTIITDHFLKLSQLRMKLPDGYHFTGWRDKWGCITNEGNTPYGYHELYFIVTERQWRNTWIGY